MKNIIISVLFAAAAVSATIANTVNPSSPADVCVVSSAVPAVTSVSDDINPVTVSDITADTSVNAAIIPAVSGYSSIPAVTTTVTLDTVPDINVSDIVITTENSVVSSAAPELVTDAENNNDIIVSDNTDTNVSDVQDDTSNTNNADNADNTDVYNINNLYALYTVVSDLDIDNDIVYCTDLNGFIWSFYGVEDWAVNDICSLTMYDNNTDIIFDDIIINCRYSGYIDSSDNNTVSDNTDNTDTVSDNTDNIDTSENDLFIEYLNAISSGDYSE